MKYRLFSDIHLEFELWKHARAIGDHFDIPELPDDKDTILLLPGDVAPLEKAYMYLPFFARMRERFKAVIFVPGNHEFYHGSFDRSVAKARPAIEMLGVKLLDNETCVIDNTLFIGSTMWSDFESNHLVMLQAQQSMNDYHLIRRGGESGYNNKLRPRDVLVRHNECRGYVDGQIKMAFNGDYDSVVVLTHHAPCHLSIAPHFASDRLNGCYYSDLSEMMDYGPVLWVHGHMHHPSDYEVYQSRVVCNPRGYEPHGEITLYDSERVIEW